MDNLYNIEILRLPKALREMNWLDYFGKRCWGCPGLGWEPLWVTMTACAFSARSPVIALGNCSPPAFFVVVVDILSNYLKMNEWLTWFASRVQAEG